jgi:S1-C subfamily serine protease
MNHNRFWRTLVAILAVILAFLMGISYPRGTPQESITTTQSMTTETTDLEAIMHATIEKITRANVYIRIRIDANTVTTGSATIIGKDDTSFFAITNAHVVIDVGSALEATATTFDGISSTFDVLDASSGQELALISFSMENREEITPLNIGSTWFDVDDTVLAIGNPLGNIGSVTVGKITDFVQINQLDLTYDTIAHDATIGQGSSGGALVDYFGNLLGINTWSLDGVYYAIRCEAIEYYIAHLL